MTEETTIDSPETVVEPQTTSAIPDGPTEPPVEAAPADPNLNPPLSNKRQKAEPEKEKVKPEPAYKYDARKAIYERRSKIMSDEQRSSDEAFDEGRQTTALPREQPDQPAAPVASADEFVTIKVYGEERRAPKAEVEKAGGVAAYQKAVAAEVKLENAARKEAALKAEEERLLRISNNLKNGLDEYGQPLAPKPPAQGVPAAIGKEALEATIKGLYSGDTEEATAALATLVEQISARQGTSNQVSPEIVRAVEAQVLERIENREANRRAQDDVAEANRIFRENFEDIANDPDMMVWAKGMAGTLAQDPNYQDKSRAEIAREVGNRIREKLGKPRTELESRRQLKQTLPQSPSGAGRVPQAEPKRFPTNADYIQQLRRNSGSNSAPR